MDINKEDALVTVTQHIIDHIKKVLSELNLSKEENPTQFLFNLITHLSMNLIIPLFKNVQDKNACKNVLDQILDQIKEGVTLSCNLDGDNHGQH
jgi:hypothetical protein